MNDDERTTQVTARPCFALGRLCMTPGASQVLSRLGRSPLDYVMRHLRGDWSDMDMEDRQANEAAVKRGGRILSAYRLPGGERLWVITEADRSVTTLLLPEEY